MWLQIIFFVVTCRFCGRIERIYLETIESGKMTKDLDLCVYGSAKPDQYLNTMDFVGQSATKPLSLRIGSAKLTKTSSVAIILIIAKFYLTLHT